MIEMKNKREVMGTTILSNGKGGKIRALCIPLSNVHYGSTLLFHPFQPALNNIAALMGRKTYSLLTGIFNDLGSNRVPSA